VREHLFDFIVGDGPFVWDSFEENILVLEKKKDLVRLEQIIYGIIACANKLSDVCSTSLKAFKNAECLLC
jgi:hypothetical protein